MSNRSDIHSPKNFRPQDYTFIDFYYVGGEPWARAANSPHTTAYIRDTKHVGPHGLGKCDHCGAWYAYGAIFQYEPTGGYIAVGHDCAEGRFETPDDFTFRRQYLSKVVLGKRTSGKKAAQIQATLDANADLAAAFEWAAEVETLLEKMVKPDGYGYSYTQEGRTYDRLVGYNWNVLADMNAKLRRYGSLSDKQIAFALKLYTEGQKKLTDAKRIVEEVAAMEPLASGRREIEGEVVSVKSVEGYTYNSPDVFKMLIALPSGHKVYTTVPQDIFDAFFAAQTANQEAYLDGGERDEALFGDGINGWLRGQRVRLTVTIKPKGNDFAIGSRPANAALIDAQELPA